MEVKIETRPAFTVLGMMERNKDGPKFIPPLWEKLMKRFGEIENLIKSRVCYGVMDNFDESTKEFNYLAGYEVEPGTKGPEGMTTWEVPEQTYAVGACTVPTIMEAYKFFSGDWLRKEKWQRAEGPEFEYYPEDFENVKTDTMYMYFPIKKT